MSYCHAGLVKYFKIFDTFPRIYEKFSSAKSEAEKEG